jgi:DNA-binding LytR/AlgR family response regulator
MKISCIIIDDEPPAIRQLEEYVSQVPFLENLGSFDNAIEPLNFLKSHKPEIVFLDIEMENFTGLQFLRALNHKPSIILTTAYDKYAVDAFNLNVTDYLLKPISFERFLQAVDKVFDIHIKQVTTQKDLYTYRRDYAFIKTEYRLQRVDFKDILYVEGMKEYLRIHTEKERIMTLLSFAEMESILPPERFIRVHKSYIVATSKINSIEKQRIRIGDAMIPISDTYKDGFYRIIQH